MAITMLDVVKAKVGEKDSYSGEDFDVAGVPIFGGCQGCEASLGGFNMYPSTTGYVRCKDCISDYGFETVQAFLDWMALENEDVT